MCQQSLLSRSVILPLVLHFLLLYFLTFRKLPNAVRPWMWKRNLWLLSNNYVSYWLNVFTYTKHTNQHRFIHTCTYICMCLNFNFRYTYFTIPSDRLHIVISIMDEVDPLPTAESYSVCSTNWLHFTFPNFTLTLLVRTPKCLGIYVYVCIASILFLSKSLDSLVRWFDWLCENKLIYIFMCYRCVWHNLELLLTVFVSPNFFRK